MRLYDSVTEARFLSRPNRFIALCESGGQVLRCHVKNTGRLGELLLPGAQVYLSAAVSPARKTAFDLVAVRRDGILFNIDSQAPNRLLAGELRRGLLGFLPDELWPEQRQGDSRFDFAFEQNGRKGFVEVKGVTLLEDDEAVFPDAPTERGVKHLQGLSALAMQGVPAHVVFILQFKGAEALRPNERTHPAFGEALRQAKSAGVCLHAFACEVFPEGLDILPRELPILL